MTQKRRQNDFRRADDANTASKRRPLKKIYIMYVEMVSAARKPQKRRRNDFPLTKNNKNAVETIFR
ncbi:MAG: hypothetical protein LBG18_03875 [Mediterranea sp.]|jgi:hypothetical protein|nr:hypothetical protein [Mediterranea sp.]